MDPIKKNLDIISSPDWLLTEMKKLGIKIPSQNAPALAELILKSREMHKDQIIAAHIASSMESFEAIANMMDSEFVVMDSDKAEMLEDAKAYYEKIFEPKKSTNETKEI